MGRGQVPGTVRVYQSGTRCTVCQRPMAINTAAHRVGKDGWRHPGCGPPRKRTLARERGKVPSPIPVVDRMTRCGTCRHPFRQGDLRFGYCKDCWKD
jgi:hypothetical protein